MEVKIKRLTETATIPTYAHANDAGMDLYADIQPREGTTNLYYVKEGHLGIYVAPHSNTLIPCGFAMAIPEGYFGAIYARSGLATKYGLRPANCVGVVDSGYRGEVMVAVHNDTSEPKIIEHGDRIAQMIVQPCPVVELTETEELDGTERGEGGFGSTDQ